MRRRSFAVFASIGFVLACGGQQAGGVPNAPPAGTELAGASPVVHESIEYKAGDTPLEGYVAMPEKGADKRPGILVFHDWMGLGPNPKKRADELAELGYVALAADLYGKGVRPTDASQASKLATQYKEDRSTLRARARAALDALVAMGNVDPAKVVAIGYCFGGTAALELARSGAPIAAVVSFHGGLSTPHPEDAKNIKGRVLALHGADDPFVKADEVAAFQDEMRKAKVDWQFVAYGGTVHSFTISDAGNDNSKGAAYNENADRRSWSAMRAFFSELWGK